MTDKYFFITDNKVQFRKRILIDAIGVDKYQRWKKVNLFPINDALTASDFLIVIYSELISMERNKSFANMLQSRYGIDELYIATLYCLHRGIDFEVIGGQYCAFFKVGSNPKDIVCGHGPTVIMAIANLYYEMSVSSEKTFIP